MTMKILLIGHRGYVGPVAARHLTRSLPGAEVHGIDANWFQGSEAAPFPDALFASQRRADVRDLTEADFRGFVCPDKFVVGYGMDMAHQFRELPFVGHVLRPA